MKALNKNSLLIMVMAGLLAVSCTESLSEEDYPLLPDNYAYIVRLKCFCYLVGPYDIEIRNGEILSFESSEYGYICRSKRDRS